MKNTPLLKIASADLKAISYISPPRLLTCLLLHASIEAARLDPQVKFGQLNIELPPDAPLTKILDLCFREALNMLVTVHTL